MWVYIHEKVKLLYYNKVCLSSRITRRKVYYGLNFFFLRATLTLCVFTFSPCCVDVEVFSRLYQCTMTSLLGAFDMMSITNLPKTYCFSHIKLVIFVWGPGLVQKLVLLVTPTHNQTSVGLVMV